MIVLGDNPFFGVNHASATRAQSYYQRLQARDWSAAHATMRAALAKDIDTFMVTTHAEAPSLLASMHADSELRRFNVIPAVPYLHRLNGLVASHGITSAFLHSMSYGRLFRGLLSSGSLKAASLYAFVMREVSEIERIGFHTPAIALQNVFVDLLLGLGLADIVNDVAAMVQKEGRRLVAITMNPTLADRMFDAQITLCTHYNCLGYMVQPNLREMQRWLLGSGRKVWAMGVLASGRAQLSDACSDPHLRRFEAVVLGASRPASIDSFVRAYRNA